MTKAGRESSAAPADDSTANKVLAMRVPGGRDVRIESDLSWGDIADISERHGVMWGHVLAGPWTVLPAKALEDIYLACCRVADVEPPKRLTPKVIVEAIQMVPDDAPDYVDDGIPTGGGQATT